MGKPNLTSSSNSDGNLDNIISMEALDGASSPIVKGCKMNERERGKKQLRSCLEKGKRQPRVGKKTRNKQSTEKMTIEQ